MAKKNKHALALRRQADLVKAQFIPEVFRTPTDPVLYEKARREFDQLNDTGDPFCAVIDTYKRLERDVKKPKKQKPLKKTKSTSTALEKVFSRSMLAEHRKKTGLDKLREELVNGLVRLASFERGVEMVYEHLNSPDNTTLAKKDFSGTTVLLGEQDFPQKDEISTISEVYPDMTADEITWLSLTRHKKPNWIYDHFSYVYWPPSLIEMDLDGLIFAHGTIEDQDREKISSTNPWEIGGLTGIDDKTELFHFDPNVAQIIKAILLLSVDDNNLYEKLWSEEDVIPTRRGDEMLLRAFMKKKRYKISKKDSGKSLQDLVADSSNSFNQDEIEKLRQQITKLYHKSYFDSPHVDDLVDFVKLIGTLE